jgi:outer membrane murein-binding lipoprotein Lpp
MEGEAAHIVLDFKVVAVIWSLVTIAFSIGAAWATIKFGIGRVSSDVSRVDSRVSSLEQRRDADRAEVIRIREEDRVRLQEALFSVESAISRRIDAQEEYMKTVFFRQDGTTNYLPRNECERCQAQCQARLDARIENVQRSIEDGERKREASKEDIVKMFINLKAELAGLIGSVNEHHQSEKESRRKE